MLRLFTFICITIMTVVVRAQGIDDYPDDRPLTIAWTHDGSAVAVGRFNGIVDIYSSAGVLKASFKAHEDGIAGLAWNPTNSRLATGGWDQWLRIWTQTGELVYESSNFASEILALQWDTTGRQIIVGTLSDPIEVWSADTLSDKYAFLAKHDLYGSSSEIQFNPSGTQIAFAQSYGGIFIHDAVSFREIVSFGSSGDDIQIFDAVWKPDGKVFIASLRNGHILGWSLAGELLFDLKANDYQGSERVYKVPLDIRFHTDGRQLTAVSIDGTIRTWEMETLQVVAEAHLPDPVFAAGISPDGTQIAYASVTSIIIIDKLADLLEPIP